jgi:2-polyprenyl-3-methyl-5-hydroxy-6-metoxy-1,4-benzoquinol methylase
MAHKWTEREIEDFLFRERLGYQRIELPYGLFTPGDGRPEFCDTIFSDVAGQSVLDVGSYLGYFCQEALRRGATSAHGIEVDKEKVRQASALAEMNALRPEFTRADIEDFPFDRPYDVVLCLNVLHHLFDPVGVIQKLARAARRKLVLEVASINPRDGRKLGLGPIARRFLERHPVIFTAPGIAGRRQRTNAQKYFFTPRAVETILRNHTKRFARVEVTPSTYKQRFVVVAHARRIRKLLVVSGLTSAGKTRFLDELAAGTLSADLRSRLPAKCEAWPQIGADDLSREPLRARCGSRVDTLELDGLCLEYDVLRPLEGATHTFARDQALDLLSVADEVVVVVVDPGPERLIQQYALGAVAAPRATKRQRWHRHELSKQLADPAFSETWLGRWRRFVAESYPRARVVTAGLPIASRGPSN